MESRKSRLWPIKVWPGNKNSRSRDQTTDSTDRSNCRPSLEGARLPSLRQKRGITRQRSGEVALPLLVVLPDSPEPLCGRQPRRPEVFLSAWRRPLRWVETSPHRPIALFACPWPGKPSPAIDLGQCDSPTRKYPSYPRRCRHCLVQDTFSEVYLYQITARYCELMPIGRGDVSACQRDGLPATNGAVERWISSFSAGGYTWKIQPWTKIGTPDPRKRPRAR